MRLRTVLAGAAVTAALPAPAHAAPAWVPAQDLPAATSQSAWTPQVAIDGAGNAVALWEGSGGIQTTSRPTGGAWTAPQAISGSNARSPRIAVDASGAATAVWSGSDGFRDRVYSATRRPGEAWTSATVLSGAGHHSAAPQLAVNAAGRATVVWERSLGVQPMRQIVQTAARSASGSWTAADDLTPIDQFATHSDVAVDPAGNAVAVWSEFDGSAQVVRAATRRADAGWTPAEDLSAAGGEADFPQVALDDAGNAVAVWVSHNGTNWVVQSATRQAGGNWTAAATRLAAGQNARSPRIALDAAGNAVALWERFNGTNWIVQSATRPAGGTWSTAANRSAAGRDARRPQIVVDATGTAIAAWERSNGSVWIAQAAVRPVMGDWSAVASLSATDARETDVALTPAGGAVVVWVRTSGGAQVAAYDAGGPRLTPDVPATAVTGVELRVSTAVLDTWSPVASVRSDFGDERDRQRLHISHTYSSLSELRPLSSDGERRALRNTSSARRTVQRGPPPLRRQKPFTPAPAVVPVSSSARGRVADGARAPSARCASRAGGLACARARYSPTLSLRRTTSMRRTVRLDPRSRYTVPLPHRTGPA